MQLLSLGYLMRGCAEDKCQFQSAFAVKHLIIIIFLLIAVLVEALVTFFFWTHTTNNGGKDCNENPPTNSGKISSIQSHPSVPKTQLASLIHWMIY